jgi:hypothetical protein
MGYSTNGQIENYEPDNTPEVLYILTYGGVSIREVILRIGKHFGDDCDLDDFTIAPEYIHTRCITYDAFDPADYDTYLVIHKR